MPTSARAKGCVPGSDEMTDGASKKGASFAAVVNLDENSPKFKCCDFFSINPKVAISQNAVEPPFPRTTSYPAGREKREVSPSRTR